MIVNKCNNVTKIQQNFQYEKGVLVTVAPSHPSYKHWFGIIVDRHIVFENNRYQKKKNLQIINKWSNISKNRIPPLVRNKKYYLVFGPSFLPSSSNNKFSFGVFIESNLTSDFS